MARLSILTLGSLHFTLDAVPLTSFNTDKAQALLAYLVIESDRAHSRGNLAALFWPEFPESRARHSLSQALFNVRDILGDRTNGGRPPFLEVSRATLQFHTDSDYWLDVEQFRAASVLSPNPQTSVEALESVEAALVLYRGSFLDGITVMDSPVFDEWVLLQRERLERRMRDMLDVLVDAYTARQSLDQALHYAWCKLDLDPWREDAHRQVMRLLAATGKRSAALDQYQHCVRLLHDELGVEPEPETTALYARLLEEKPVTASVPRPETQASTAPQHNLPVQLTPIIGREAEREMLASLMQQPETRLVTLTGAGGCGKTRLVLDVAWSLVGQFPQGIWFVPMASFDSAEAVINGIANALGVPLSKQAASTSGRGDKVPLLEQLQVILHHRTALLVLDNAEQLVQSDDGQDGLADVLTTLLEHAPGIKMLVTSRNILHSAGEVVVSLHPLDYPKAQDETLDMLNTSATVKVFLHAARRVRPNFTLAGRNQQAVAAICNYVQGCPLATLLAASWTATLSAAEIADMLTHPEENNLRSLDMLQSDWQDFPTRHRDLRSVYEHSWRLLTPKAQKVFAVCCLFRGGFTRNAAREIAGANAFDLRVLVEASLIMRQPSGRYVIHELLRQFGEEKLQRDPIVWRNARSRYTDYYVVATQRWVVDAQGPLQQMMMEDMDVEYDNLRSAWLWCVEDNDAANLIEMFEALRQYLYQRWYDDEIIMLSNAALSHFEPMLSESRVQNTVILMLAYATILKAWAVSYTEVKDLAQQAKDLLSRPELSGTDTRYVHACLHDLWAYYYMYIDRNKAREHFDLLIDSFQDLNYRWYLGWALFKRGGLAWHVSDFPQALHYYRRAAVIAEEVQNPRMLATVKSTLARHAMATGQMQEALQYSLENVAMVRKLNDPLALVNALYNLGFKYMMLGQFDAVLDYIGESRDILWDKFGRIGVLHNSVYGWALACQGDYAQGEQMQLRAMEGLRAMPEPRSEAWVALIMGFVRMGQARFKEAIQSLQYSIEIYTPLEQWMELTNVHSCLGHAYALDCNLLAARKHLFFSATVALERQMPLSIVWTLPGFTILAVRSERLELAITAYHVALTVPIFANAQWFHDVVGQHVEAASAHLPPDLIEAAQAHGRALNVPEIVRDLMAEFT